MREAFSTQPSVGPWNNVKNRYLGLKFQIKGKIHYGWARLNVTGSGLGTIVATMTGYAYETIPNKAIVAAGKNRREQKTVWTSSARSAAWRLEGNSTWAEVWLRNRREPLLVRRTQSCLERNQLCSL